MQQLRLGCVAEDCGPQLQRHILLRNGLEQPPLGSQHVLIALRIGLTRTVCMCAHSQPSFGPDSRALSRSGASNASTLFFDALDDSPPGSPTSSIGTPAHMQRALNQVVPVVIDASIYA